MLVAAEIARLSGAEGTTPMRLVDACRTGTLELVLSRSMLNRLVAVFTRHPRLNFSLESATARAELLAETAALSNLLVVGGGVAPISDTEDQGVLETALAGRAAFLGTYNLKDFRGADDSGRKSGLRVRGIQIMHPADLAARLAV